jgi:hypothetical protein
MTPSKLPSFGDDDLQSPQPNLIKMPLVPPSDVKIRDICSFRING